MTLVAALCAIVAIGVLLLHQTIDFLGCPALAAA
jgi:hypothetical protein